MPSEYGIETDCVTLQRHILEQQKRFPGATGDLTNLLTSLLTAVKVRRGRGGDGIKSIGISFFVLGNFIGCAQGRARPALWYAY